MKRLSALLALSEGNPFTLVNFLHKEPRMMSFKALFYVSLNQLLNEHSSFRWYDAPWHWCDVTVMVRGTYLCICSCNQLVFKRWYIFFSCYTMMAHLREPHTVVNMYVTSQLQYWLLAMCKRIVTVLIEHRTQQSNHCFLNGKCH